MTSQPASAPQPDDDGPLVPLRPPEPFPRSEFLVLQVRDRQPGLTLSDGNPGISVADYLSVLDAEDRHLTDSVEFDGDAPSSAEAESVTSALLLKREIRRRDLRAIRLLWHATSLLPDLRAFDAFLDAAKLERRAAAQVMRALDRLLMRHATARTADVLGGLHAMAGASLDHLAEQVEETISDALVRLSFHLQTPQVGFSAGGGTYVLKQVLDLVNAAELDQGPLTMKELRGRVREGQRDRKSSWAGLADAKLKTGRFAAMRVDAWLEYAKRNRQQFERARRDPGQDGLKGYLAAHPEARETFRRFNLPG